MTSFNNGQTPDNPVNKNEGDTPSRTGIPIFHWIMAAVWAPCLMFGIYVEVDKLVDALPSAPTSKNSAAHSERPVQAMQRQDHK